MSYLAWDIPLFLLVAPFMALQNCRIIYFAALERVTILYAIYLLFLTVFMAYPPLVQKGWIGLVIYCEVAITFSYVWGFTPNGLIASNRTLELIGVEEGSNKHMWTTLRWHIAILGLSVVQLIILNVTTLNRAKFAVGQLKNAAAEEVYASLESGDAVHANYGSITADEGPLNTGSADSAIGNPSKKEKGWEWTQLVDYLFHRYWFAVPLLLIVSVQFTGDTSLIGIGFLVVTFTIILTYRMGLRNAAAKSFYIALLYSAGVILLTYGWQFHQYSTKNETNSNDTENSIGLKLYAADDQTGRFKYLLSPVLIFIACIIQVRGALDKKLAHKIIAFGPASKVVRFVKLLVLYMHRVLWLQGTLIAGFVVFAACVLPDPDVVGVVTLGFLFAVLWWPNSGGVQGLLMFWIMLVAIVKMLVQLPLLDVDLDEYNSTFAWVGFTTIPDKSAFSAVKKMQFDLYAIGALMVAASARIEWTPRLWPDAEARNPHRRLFADASQLCGGWVALLSTAETSIRRNAAQTCAVSLVVAAFVRLNVISVVYLILLLMLPTDDASKLQPAAAKKLGRRVSSMIMGVSVLLLAQYASAVGIPPTFDYPYSAWSENHPAGLALLRWLYVSPVHAGPGSKMNGTDFRAEKAPGSWEKPVALFADFTALCFMHIYRHHLSIYSKNTPNFAHVDEPNPTPILRNPIFTGADSLTRAEVQQPTPNNSFQVQGYVFIKMLVSAVKKYTLV
jgi:hypothetical protein